MGQPSYPATSFPPGCSYIGNDGRLYESDGRQWHLVPGFPQPLAGRGMYSFTIPAAQSSGRAVSQIYLDEVTEEDGSFNIADCFKKPDHMLSAKASTDMVQKSSFIDPMQDYADRFNLDEP